MQKIIRTIDEKRGIVQVTTVDERFYARPTNDKVTGLPMYEFVPSVTFICDFYPKGIAFFKWLASKGWDESQALKEAAGDKGSKVHAAIEELIDGHTLTMESQIVNPSTGVLEPLTLDEYQAIMSFVDWFKAVKPVVLGRELTVWNQEHQYAGTVDLLCTIDGELTIVDFKTSKAVWPSHRMQVSAYKHAQPKWATAKLMILQLGYERNRLGYKATDVEDCFPLFLAAKQIWAEETKGQTPSQKDYPVSLTLVTPPPATASADAGAADTGGTNGGTGELGQETKQNAHPRRRGNGGSRVSGVQDRREPVRS